MNARVCRCCGEPMPEHGNPPSRNPNICASCSGLADETEESGLPKCASLEQDTAEPFVEDELRERAA